MGFKPPYLYFSHVFINDEFEPKDFQLGSARDLFHFNSNIFFNSDRDHPFKTSACLRGEGYPHVPMVQRSQYIRIKNPLHKHFAGMPMVGG